MIFNNHPLIFASSEIPDGNMSYIKGDAKEASENRKKFLKKFGLDLKNAINLSMQHDNKAVIVTLDDSGKGTLVRKEKIWADAIITNQKNLTLMLLTGDCLPIGVFDPDKQVVALIHGSKKSLELGVLENTVFLLIQNFDVNPKSLIVSIGPSIGPCCYYNDLWSLAEKKLIKMGLVKKNIFNSKVCTYHNGQYFSHRKSVDLKLKDDFRLATILTIKD